MKTKFVALTLALVLSLVTNGIVSAAPEGTEFQVNTYTLSIQRNPAVTMDVQGNSIITWSSYGQDDDIWGGIYAQKYDHSGNPVGAEFQVNTYTSDDQDYPAVAMDAQGNSIITWSSFGQDGDGYGIYAQKYDRSGNPVGAEFQVNTYTTDNQDYPAVAMNAQGNSIITWASDGQDGDGRGIYAQRYDRSGNPVGAEFQVNTYTSDDQDYPAVAMDTQGNSVMTWSSYGQDGYAWGIYAQRYDRSGNPVGAEFQVNTYNTSSQKEAAVAMNAQGNSIITWSSYGQDGYAWGIYAQRYDRSGNPVGAEFQVNTYTTGFQEQPAVAMNAQGNSIITWASYGLDGDDWDIYAQRFNKN